MLNAPDARERERRIAADDESCDDAVIVKARPSGAPSPDIETFHEDVTCYALGVDDEDETTTIPRGDAHERVLGGCLVCRPDLRPEDEKWCSQCDGTYTGRLADHLRLRCDRRSTARVSPTQS
jgi:hypothetical protein